MLKQVLAAFSVKPGTELEEEDAGAAGAGPSGTLDTTDSPAGPVATGSCLFINPHSLGERMDATSLLRSFIQAAKHLACMYEK